MLQTHSVSVLRIVHDSEDRVGKLRQAGSVTSRSDIESTLLTANVNLIGARRKGRDEGGGSRVCERVLDVEGLWACAPSRLEAG